MARKLKDNGSDQVPRESRAREIWLSDQVSRIMKTAERVGNRLVFEMWTERFSVNDMNAASEIDSRLREKLGIPVALRMS